MTFDRICLGTAEDKFFCDHYRDYGDGCEKFIIDQPASSPYHGKHFAIDPENLDLLDELLYTPKHQRENDEQQDVHGEARCLIPHSDKQSSHFSTGKSNRTSKDRRYIPFPDEKSGWNRVRTGGGKGSQHRKAERLLNQ